MPLTELGDLTFCQYGMEEHRGKELKNNYLGVKAEGVDCKKGKGVGKSGVKKGEREKGSRFEIKK